jgi:hypothetical protein
MTKQLIQRGTILRGGPGTLVFDPSVLGSRPPVQGIEDQIHNLTAGPHGFSNLDPS